MLTNIPSLKPTQLAGISPPSGCQPIEIARAAVGAEEVPVGARVDAFAKLAGSRARPHRRGRNIGPRTARPSAGSSCRRSTARRRVEPQPGLHVEEVVEEALVAGDPAPVRALRRVPEEAQRRQRQVARLRPRAPAALDADRVGGQREADRGDARESAASASGPAPARSSGSPCPRRSGRSAARCLRRRRAGCGRSRRYATGVQPGSALPANSSDEPWRSLRRSRQSTCTGLRIGGRTDDEFGRVQFAARRGLPRLRGIETSRSSARSPSSAMRTLNGRQAEVAGERNVVETDDRDLFRNASTGLREAPAARRSPSLSLAAKTASNVWPDFSSAVDRRLAQFLVEVALNDLALETPSSRPQPLKRVRALAARRCCPAGTGDVDDPLAAERKRDGRRPPRAPAALSSRIAGCPPASPRVLISTDGSAAGSAAASSCSRRDAAP